MIGHKSAALNLFSEDKNKTARALEWERIIPADFIIVQKRLANGCCGGFSIHRAVSHFKIVLGLLRVVPARDEDLAIRLTVTQEILIIVVNFEPESIIPDMLIMDRLFHTLENDGVLKSFAVLSPRLSSS